MEKQRGLGKSLPFWTLAIAVAGYAAYSQAFAEEGADSKNGLTRQRRSHWAPYDESRPLPPVVTPGRAPGDPPSDAIRLFDGKDLSKWRKRDKDEPASCKVENGYFEVINSGYIVTIEKFRDVQLHIEWQAPSPPRNDSQFRGNSGIFFMDRYELQILDSYNNKTYADGSAAAIYSQHPPIANVCRPPGEWQTYDVVFRAPRFKEGKIVESARLTVFHNGALVHHNAEVYGPTLQAPTSYGAKDDVKEGAISIQDHGDNQVVRFRNVWARKLSLTEESNENE